MDFHMAICMADLARSYRSGELETLGVLPIPVWFVGGSLGLLVEQASASDGHKLSSTFFWE